jgi:ASC-1-like (ASCH) protein
MDNTWHAVQNTTQFPFLDQIKSGQKVFEGRLTAKIKEWDLEIGKEIGFYSTNPDLQVRCKITKLDKYPDFLEALHGCGNTLIPNGTVADVCSIYNGIFHYDNENVGELNSAGKMSKKILDIGVVCIGLEVLK